MKTKKPRAVILRSEEIRTLIDVGTVEVRRRVEPQPQPNGGKGFHPVYAQRLSTGNWNWCLDTGMGTGDPFPHPFGSPGDVVAVKETYWCDHCFAGDYQLTANSGRVGRRDHEIDRAACEKEWLEHCSYRADGEAHELFEDCSGFKWSPPLTMPAWAIRLHPTVLTVDCKRMDGEWFFLAVLRKETT